MDSSHELLFIDQAVRYHAAGGGIDAPVLVTFDRSDGSDRVRIENPIWETDEVETLLFCAAREGWSSAVTCCLERGADVNLRLDNNSWTPLDIASCRGHCHTAVLLLDAGARVVDHDGVTGQTALHFAAGFNHCMMCKLLLSRGASFDECNVFGQDPEAQARTWASTTTADLLAAVRAAGGWSSYLEAPRKELLALRQQLPALRDCGRAAPSSSVRVHERLFLDAPDDVFTSVFAFWRSDRDD